jgi:hypothetical protein
VQNLVVAQVVGRVPSRRQTPSDATEAPGAIMVLGCWTAADPAHLQEIVKVDEVVNTLGAVWLMPLAGGKRYSAGLLGACPEARTEKDGRKCGLAHWTS